MKKNILLLAMIFSLTQAWSFNNCLQIDTSCSVTLTQIQGGFCLQATAEGTAPFTFVWDDGQAGDVACSNNPNGSGTLCVTMTDAAGCVATACGTIGNNSNCSVNIQQDSLFGTTGIELTAQATGTAPFTYQWSTGELTSSIIVNYPGDYCVVVTDANGCVATSCVEIEDNNNPNCSVEIDLTPIGGLVAVTDGNAPFTYLWSTGEITEFIFPMAPGNYCVTVTGANGCVADDCYYYDIGGNDTLCYVTVQQIAGTTCLEAIGSGTAPFEYVWQNGTTGPELCVNAPGTYCVTMIDAANCASTACGTIGNPNQDSCSVIIIGNTGSGALVADAGGVAPFIYQWNTGELTQSIFPTVNGQYCVTITDATGCVADACYYYSNNPNDTTCNVIVEQIQGGTCLQAIASGTAPFSYQWDTGQTGMTLCANNPMGGTYCVTMTDANGCVSTACGTIGGGGQDSCNVIIELTANGSLVAIASGQSGYTYLWNTGETTPYINPNSPGNYCVTIIDTTGCEASDCFTLYFAHEVVGYVTLGDSTEFAMGATVYLIEYDPVEGTLTEVDQTTTGNQIGAYIFENVEPGEYLVKAALNQNAVSFGDNLPTYYQNVLWWHEATAITVPSLSPNTNYIINLIAGDNPGGPGFIGGLVSEGANFAGSEDDRGDGDPIPGVSIILLDENDNPVTHAVTNDEGEYAFDNLAWGTYKVYIEIPGIEQVWTLVTIGPENPTVNGIDFIVDENSAATVSISSILETESLEVFPNPVNDLFYIQWNSKKNSEVLLSLTDVNGRLISQEKINLYPGLYTHKLDLETSPSGIYFINIINGKDSVSRKVLKK